MTHDWPTTPKSPILKSHCTCDTPAQAGPLSPHGAGSLSCPGVSSLSCKAVGDRRACRICGVNYPCRQSWNSKAEHLALQHQSCRCSWTPCRSLHGWIHHRLFFVKADWALSLNSRFKHATHLERRLKLLTVNRKHLWKTYSLLQSSSCFILKI